MGPSLGARPHSHRQAAACLWSNSGGREDAPAAAVGAGGACTWLHFADHPPTQPTLLLLTNSMWAPLAVLRMHTDVPSFKERFHQKPTTLLCCNRRMLWTAPGGWWTRAHPSLHPRCHPLQAGQSNPRMRTWANPMAARGVPDAAGTLAASQPTESAATERRHKAVKDQRDSLADLRSNQECDQPTATHQAVQTMPPSTDTVYVLVHRLGNGMAQV